MRRRVTILEWICGGGLSAVPSQQIPQSLLSEGAAMLSCLLHSFCELGCHVSTAIDSRLLAAQPWRADKILSVPGGHPAAVSNQVPPPWFSLAQDADLTLVIAPELDGILPRTLQALAAAGAQLLNCSDEFLCNACDKLLTAACLSAVGIAHPPTLRVSDLTNEWLAALPADRVVLKPRDGAGSEGILVIAKQSLAGRNLQPWMTKHIVQPLLPGRAYSCSCIVDRRGRAVWLPLVTQELNENLAYGGGQVVGAELQSQRPLELLDQTLAALKSGALGWIGVDLLFDPQTQTWHVIEVNPRCTTSMVGLANLCRPSLAHLLCEAADGLCVNSDWEPQRQRFTADGQHFDAE